MADAIPDPIGTDIFERVLARPAPRKPFAGLRELAINHLFAKVWTRSGLSIRDRRLVTIAMLAAQGRGDQLRDHIRGALLGDDPLREEEIEELMVHVAHYAGWAAGASGQSAASEVLSAIQRE